MAIGKLHLLVLHFPLALILVAALADALWLWRRKPIFREAGYFCILLGALAAIPAMATGLILIDTMHFEADEAGTAQAAEDAAHHHHDADDAALAETHESLGIVTTCVAFAAAGVRLFGRNKLPKMWAWMYGVLMAGAVVLVTLTGHYGGLLAFGRDYLSGVFGQ